MGTSRLFAPNVDASKKLRAGINPLVSIVHYVKAMLALRSHRVCPTSSRQCGTGEKLTSPEIRWYIRPMASGVTKRVPSLEDLLLPLPPEGPELDALIKAKVEEALADPRPGIPMAEVFDGLRKRLADRAGREA